MNNIKFILKSKFEIASKLEIQKVIWYQL